MRAVYAQPIFLLAGFLIAVSAAIALWLVKRGTSGNRQGVETAPPSESMLTGDASHRSL